MASFDNDINEAATHMSGDNQPAVDIAHLERQTLGDRALEREVLALFLEQASRVCDDLAGADGEMRRRLAHALKGSARGIGAFRVAACVADIEANPFDQAALERLALLIEEVRAFVAERC